MSEALNTDEDFYANDINEAFLEFDEIKVSRQQTLKAGPEARRRIEELLENKRLRESLKNGFED